MLKLGNLTFKKPVILAPLAGLTSLPFRMLNRSFGCEFAFTEMIDAKSLIHSSWKTMDMLKTVPEDQPLGVQLVGNSIDDFYKSIDALKDFNYKILDINAACPQRKVAGKDKGASLLKDPAGLNRLLEKIVKYSKVPVTVKIRLGWNSTDFCEDIAKAAADAGVCAIFVHGRTKVQLYGGKVNYEEIKKVKDAVKIPVIASGDIFTPFLAKTMLDQTGVDAVLAARGSLGNPWIFNEIGAFLKTGKLPQRPSIAEIIDVMKLHLKMFIEHFGEERAVVRFRLF